MPTGAVEQPLADILAEVDRELRPGSEADVHHRVSPLRAALIARGDTPSLAMEGESIALSIHAFGDSDNNPWDLHFGPMFTGITKDGTTWEVPSLSAVTPEVLAYWRGRARAAMHPVLRARYADLLWELPRRIEGAVRDVEMARIAIDAYIAAASTLLYGDGTGNIDAAQRALVLALAISDLARVERARDTLIALEPEVTDETGLGMFGFCFETFLEPPHPKVQLTPEQATKVVGAMERSLASAADSAPTEYIPGGAERAALLLAAYYRRRGEAAQVARVMRTYADAILRMEGTAAPMVYSHALQALYGQLLQFGLRAEADALNERIRVAGIASAADMKSITVERTIPQVEVEKYVNGVLRGDSREALVRIALHFLPRRVQLEPALRKLHESAAFLAMMPKSITDGFGRTVAVVGSATSDPEGRYIDYMGLHLGLSMPWLREIMRRGLDGHAAVEVGDHETAATPPRFGRDDILVHLFDGPCFAPERRPLVEAAVDAYLRLDAVTAIHLLVPQIEQAVRQAAILVGAPIYSPRRGGGLNLRTLDELLRDATLGATLGDDIATYLRALLTDARAWNVRNVVCHGMAQSGSLDMAVADRVLHAALVIALLQRENADGDGAASAVNREPDESPTPEQDASP